MNLYPALRSKMGEWDYYIVKMSARELAENVQLASSVYDENTLDEEIQRTLDEEIQRTLRKSRASGEIVEYLKRQPYRFFSSIVVAALEGNPMFYPVEITEDPQFVIFREDERLNEAFGLLKFDGNQKYYALDGQHRLSAIKNLLGPPVSDGTPEGFENDEFSVIVVVPNQLDSNNDFMQKYRRLFTNLNRYAKKTDNATNIIMDEDDTFAIITRRLITNHEFFKSPESRQKDSSRIKTSSKNLGVNDPHFTSLETLYEMNITLLKSPQRVDMGWGEDRTDEDTFKRFRPSEEYIDGLYNELEMYWVNLLEEIPALHKVPKQMRVHDLEDNIDSENETDHLLFWPIGQQMLAEIARTLLDKHLTDPGNPTSDTVSEALSGLSELEWRLHKPPWLYFLLVRNAKGSWSMRNEQRLDAVRCGRIIQQWILGVEEFDEDDVIELKKEWMTILVPAQTEETANEMWQKVEDMKTLISG